MQHIYYCVLKNYKGLFKKKHIGNSYILITPLSDSVYAILGIVGEISDEENIYSSVLVFKVPNDVIDDLVLLEVEEFKWRFEIVEKIECSVKKIEDSTYKISLKEKGDFIQSDILIKYDIEHSSDPVRIYIIHGKFVFPSGYIVSPNKDMKMMAIKKNVVIKHTMQNIIGLFRGKNNDK